VPASWQVNAAASPPSEDGTSEAVPSIDRLRLVDEVVDAREHLRPQRPPTLKWVLAEVSIHCQGSNVTS
jgi:hypothetical protein